MDLASYLVSGEVIFINKDTNIKFFWHVKKYSLFNIYQFEFGFHFLAWVDLMTLCFEY
jgi:hypothetical protein